MRIRLLKRISGSFAEYILEKGTNGQWEMSLEVFQQLREERKKYRAETAEMDRVQKYLGGELTTPSIEFNEDGKNDSEVRDS